LISATRKNSVREIAALQDPRWLGDHTVPHRAFRTLQPSSLEMALGFLVAVAATAGWIVLLPRVASLWVKLLSFWIGRLWPGTSVLLLPRTVVGHWQVPVPYFTVDAGPISGWTWVAIAAGSVVLFLASYRIPIDNHLPYMYMMRAFALIQGSALLYTALAQRPFPADPSEYCASMLLFGMIYIGLMPGILGFTFYIFDVSIWRKIALTIFIMAHLTLFIPLQYLTHACILHVSLLFLPLLYFVFGPLIDVVVLLGFYSWGMSWPSADGVAGYPYTAGAPVISVPQRYR
jgi:hypothetical protein